MPGGEVEQDISHLGSALTSYCFGGLSDADRDDIERHLMDCETCWDEFQRLDAAVRTLRFDAALRPILQKHEVISLLGLSSRLDSAFGGHTTFVVAMAALFGLEWMIGLWSELGYAYDRFGTLAWTLSAPVALWVTASLIISLWFDVVATRAGRTYGLFGSVTMLVGSLAVVVVALMGVLPAEPTIQASFQTRTAAIGYFKDAIVIFLPLLVFLLPPFHAIVALQRELRARRAELVVALLTRRADALVPRGMWHLTPSFLTGFLAATGALKIAGTNHMLDALTPGPYAGLFSMAAYVSTGLWFTIGVTSVAWYSANLNELKREAIALAVLTKPLPTATQH